ncbi:unnamed protein product [Rotaria socialis]|uniref:Uncharacterized protein n=1 Tax=Rotaria socialis TaxID=392032 RepID=A0A818E1S6_9BILA|nr:unnamed protein product [Rotaria socialis]
MFILLSNVIDCNLSQRCLEESPGSPLKSPQGTRRGRVDYGNLISILSGLTTRMLAGYAADLTNTIGWLCKIRIFFLMTSRTVALASVDRWFLLSTLPKHRQRSSLKDADRSTFMTILISIIIYAQLVYCYEAN